MERVDFSGWRRHVSWYSSPGSHQTTDWLLTLPQQMRTGLPTPTTKSDREACLAEVEEEKYCSRYY